MGDGPGCRRTLANGASRQGDGTGPNRRDRSHAAGRFTDAKPWWTSSLSGCSAKLKAAATTRASHPSLVLAAKGLVTVLPLNSNSQMPRARPRRRVWRPRRKGVEPAGRRCSAWRRFSRRTTAMARMAGVCRVAGELVARVGLASSHNQRLGCQDGVLPTQPQTACKDLLRPAFAVHEHDGGRIDFGGDSH